MSTNTSLAPDGAYVQTTASATAGPGAVSWGAIFAGAAGAAALSLILLILGVGLGLSSVSPWAGEGVSATTFGASTVVWLILTQLAASGMGGYLAGRLRTRWVSTHTDEVYFRDTAHGFLAWAVASLVTAAMLASAAASIVSGTAQAGATVAGGAAATAVAAVPAVAGAAQATGAMPSQSSAQGYFVDALFRRDMAAAPAAEGASSASGTGTTPDAGSMGMQPQSTSMTGPDGANRSTAEAGRIFASSMASGSLSPEDTKYIGQMIAQRTGMPAAEAEKRATDTFARMQASMKQADTAARDAADQARKASAHAALWTFVSLLIGAFVASLSATYGGRRRDLV